jgi:hypothetical protein
MKSKKVVSKETKKVRSKYTYSQLLDNALDYMYGNSNLVLEERKDFGHLLFESLEVAKVSVDTKEWSSIVKSIDPEEYDVQEFVLKCLERDLNEYFRTHSLKEQS